MANLAINLAVGLVGQLLYNAFKPAPPDIEGARIDDLNVPAVSAGQPRARVWGKMKVRGQLLWTTGLVETVHTEYVKGGKGGKAQKSTTYTYSSSLMVGVCEGEARILVIYAQEKVLWQAIDQDVLDDYATALADYTSERQAYYAAYYATPTFASFTPQELSDMAQERVDYDVDQWKKQNDEDAPEPEYDSLTVYSGSETQTPNPAMEAYEGIGNVPAYRGTCYFVVDNLELANYGNTLPQVRVMVEKLNQDGEPPTIMDIVIDLVEEAGLINGDEFFVKPTLATMKVAGYAITRPASARQAIEQLQIVHPFDVIESGDKVLFRNRDRLPIGIVNWDDMRAHTYGDTENGNKLERSRTDDPQLPKEIKLTYQDVTRDYSANQVTEPRYGTRSTEVRQHDLQIATNPQTMKKAAEVGMSVLVAERNSFVFTLPPKYLRFDVGDVIMLPTGIDDYQKVRLTQMDLGGNYIIACKAVSHVLSESSIVAHTEENYKALASREYPATTKTFILDIPSLDDTEQETGVYVVFSADTANWGGGALYRDVFTGSAPSAFGSDIGLDIAGTNWELQLTSILGAHSGTVHSKLGIPVIVGALDVESELRVTFWSQAPTFVTQSQEALSTGNENVFYVGGEIIQAKTVTQLDAQTFVFSGLLRGLRGTEYACYNHVVGEDIVHVHDRTTNRWVLKGAAVGASDKDKDIKYRATSQGLDVMLEPTVTFPFSAASDKAFGPILANNSRTTTGDITANIIPRTNYDGQWPVFDPQSTVAPEKYKVSICDIPAYEGAHIVLRTILVDATRVFSYSAAQQVADFGATQEIINIKITQESVDGRDGLPSFEVI